ncbi:hypothetical protein HYFRA_00007898 [Hymenoscyphus fraxineus]|uniref:GED domain-containing protein n=1 Tax=Hymenoscyphus fraxineus TaxID=746836 RepID=A0A9N9KSC6_9HELO|nr:hypothetical protein HYFRA_00007898 [Hymenoscyphus fraxineus]
MSKRMKRESYGIPTPEDTMSISTTPKSEEVEVRWSDVPKDTSQGSNEMDTGGHQNGTAATRSKKRQRTEDSNQSTHQGGLEIVGQNVKKLIDAIEELRSIGLKKHVTCLPELVLVGDQSSGKSSLMGAIAHISLPRGSGTCTRCPTNIRTSEAEKWTCEVSLQEMYSYDPRSKAGPFPNWVERQDALSNKPFKTIGDKSELEEVMKWAQIAILNPDKDSSLYIPGTATQAQEAILRNGSGDYFDQTIFSPNVISVAIAGPGLSNLSFYDLPGLFKVPRNKREEGGPKFCENLTMKYVRHERALIICAMSMHNDPAVSVTKEVINRCKANDRCVGVLTMPDRMQGVYHQDYNDLFDKKAYVLPYGYFVTKQPGVDSLLLKAPMTSDYHRRALLEEEQFFDQSRLYGSNGIWSHFRSRCGTSTIQEFLSKEFVQMILRSIPDIQSDVQNQATGIQTELENLPEVCHEQAQFIVRQRLAEFSDAAEGLLSGNARRNNKGGRKRPEESFQYQWKKLSSRFRDTLEHMQPEMNCSHPPSDGVRPRTEEQINLVSDDDDEGNNRAQTSRQAFDTTVLRTPNKNPIRPQTPIKQELASPSRMRRLMPTQLGQKYGPFCQDYLYSGRNFMTIADLQKGIDFHTGNGEPDNVSFKIKEEYVLTAIQPWKLPLETFHNTTFTILRKEILQVLSEVLKNYKDTLLFRRSKEYISDLINHYDMIQHEKLFDLYNIEHAALFTMNLDGFREHKQHALAKLNTARKEARIEAWLNTVKLGHHKDKEHLRKNVKEEDLVRFSLFQKELEIAAYVIGYYNLARIRFVDTVCCSVNVTTIEAMKKGFKNLLEKKFDLFSPNCDEIARMLISENPTLANERSELLKTQKKLENAMKVLEGIRALTDTGRRDSEATMDIDMMDQSENNGWRNNVSVHPDDESVDFAQ